MKQSAPTLLITALILSACTSAPIKDDAHYYQELPDGTAVKIIKDSVHHPPAKYYAEIGPDYKKSQLIKPDRNEGSYLARWYNIGRIVCEGKEPIPVYGPRTDGPYLMDFDGKSFCTPHSGEPDCGLVVYGYFYCAGS